jgi:glycogen operon protein
VLFNAGDDPVDFVIPPDEYSAFWEIVVDTVGEQADSHPRAAGESISVDGKAVIVLRAHTPSKAEAEADHSVAASLAPAPAPSAPEPGHISLPDTPGRA